jgi:hypothetical protein
VTVPQGVTLTIKPGAVVAGKPWQGLVVTGRLEVEGTADHPVTLTSTRDELRSFGDGHPPGAGAWLGVRVDGDGAVAHLDGVRLRYGFDCLRVDRGYDVRVSGQVAECIHGVVSYDLFVRAFDVDWGSPTGPAPFGHGSSITNLAIAAVPWRGFVPPDMPSEVTPQPAPADLRCVDLAMYGVRGAGEAPQPADGESQESYSNDAEGLGTIPYGASLAQWQAVANARPTTVKLVALRYSALGFSGAQIDLNHHLREMLAGVVRLRQVIDDELTRCPNTQVSVVGMSLGAMVVRLYLGGLAGPVPADHIAAVAMVGDPTRASHPAELTWSDGNTQAPSSLTAISGVWAGLFTNGAIPASVSGRTISLCRADDSLCAPGPGTTLTGHARYARDDIEAVGAWMGARVLPRLQ